ncbi:MAG: hypothetical protein M1834_003407 [Cirrosporium novae-zelandiae]|nr:MAG: hypothetical protein M1834_003407 [Cirrosporium novae-zelandiae]
MDENSESPLLLALPPTTDYMTYLTILEYQLNAAQLPTLHKVLQDTTLTNNIGWDLVHLLLPLLPESHECLQDVARFGNPREVILKVTESLVEIAITIQDKPESNASSNCHENLPSSQSPLHILQFTALLSMLEVLHPRIKTKHPTRFLSTSLQAVLRCYNNLISLETTIKVFDFIKHISGLQRPVLPPRRINIYMEAAASSYDTATPDPEAQHKFASDEEAALQKRLIQAFLTFVLETYLRSLASKDDVPGLAWASRAFEIFEPRRVIPVRKTYSQRFIDDDDLRSRDSLMRNFTALACDLGISSDELLAVIQNPEEDFSEHDLSSDELPSAPSDVCLSYYGSLYLFAAQESSHILFDSQSCNSDICSIFPHHAAIVKNYVGKSSQSDFGIGPEPLIDGILYLGLQWSKNNKIGAPVSDEVFLEYLSTLSMLCINTRSPSLRGHIHTLTTLILLSHPSDFVVLSFIRHILENMDHPALKSSAVSWLKTAILAAVSALTDQLSICKHSETSIFATQLPLTLLLPAIFPSLRTNLLQVPLPCTWQRLRTNISFYLSALNFYYLIIARSDIRERLNIQNVHRDYDVAGLFLQPLGEAVGRLKEGFKEGGELKQIGGNDDLAQGLGDVLIIEERLSIVTEAVARFMNNDTNQA